MLLIVIKVVIIRLASVCHFTLLVGNFISLLLIHLSTGSDRHNLVPKELSNRAPNDHYQVSSNPWCDYQLLKLNDKWLFFFVSLLSLRHQSSFSLSITREVRGTCMMCLPTENRGLVARCLRPQASSWKHTLHVFLQHLQEGEVC